MGRHRPNDTALLLGVNLRLEPPHSALDAVNFGTRIAATHYLLDNDMRGDPREHPGVGEDEDEDEEDLWGDDEGDYYEARPRARRRRPAYTHHPREDEEGEEGRLPSGCGAAIVVTLIIALLMMPIF